MTRIKYIPNRVIDRNGISDGAELFVYQTGTTTKVPLFSDEGLTQPIANPLVAPVGAEVPTFYTSFEGNIRLRIIDRRGNVAMDEDPYLQPIFSNDVQADIIIVEDGGNLQNAIAAAETPLALLATTESFPVGSTLRTADGFLYKVAAPGASDNHLVTDGGVKLYVIQTGSSARQWGVYPNTGADLAARLNMAGANHRGLLQFDEGLYLTSRGVRQQVNGSIFRGLGVSKTIIRGISLANNGKMSETNPNGAIIWAMGGEGAPLYGLKCEDMTLDCAGLMTGLPTGDVFMKGHHYRRVWGMEVNRVEVLDCGSYAFWANDKLISEGGTITGSRGVYNDCVAKDAEIFFETVGRNYLTYNRCRAEQTRTSWNWPIYEVYHPYAGDGFIVYNDCYAKCSASSIIGPGLTMKNVIFNGGYFEQLNPEATAINMTGEFANFDNWAFNNVNIVAAGLIGPISFGLLSNASAKMTISGGRWEAKTSLGPVFTAINDGWGSVDIEGLDCVSTTTGGAVPFSMTVTGRFKQFLVVGGNQEAYGPSVTASPVNATSARFRDTKFIPSGAVLIPNIRQQKVGVGVPINNGGFGQINFAMPLNIANVDKVVVCAAVKASATNSTGAGEGLAYTWNNPATNTVNILVPVAGVGRTITYSVTEYE